MSYTDIVEKIRRLPWGELSPLHLQKLMIFSAYTAREFAESLRISLQLYPCNQSIQSVAHGELCTNNLSYGSYRQTGDHADFLWHFLNEYQIPEKYPESCAVGEQYIDDVHKLSDTIRAMSIFSRETELVHIFRLILTANDWVADGLSEYRHYLTRHIELDSAPQGHGEQLANFEITEDVALFYEIRLEAYKNIITQGR